MNLEKLASPLLRRITLGLNLLASVALAQTQPEQAPKVPDECKESSCYDFSPVRALIHQKLDDKTDPSIAVAVAKDGKIIWEEAFGWADRENQIPATSRTIYSLASLTKPYTATGVMVLVSAHKIDLNAAVQQYVQPAQLTVRVGERGPTVREVLVHTGGLPTFYFFHYKGSWDASVDMQETVRPYGIIVHAPGKIWEYSNLGYGIMDYMTSRVSGLPWAEYMRRNVFAPLGLKHTTVGTPRDAEAVVAPRYDDETHRRLPPFDFDHSGASAIFADVHDVIRFGMFQLKNKLPDQQPVLTNSMIDEMMLPANLDANAGTQRKPLYGLGWQIEREFGYDTVGHEGAMVGTTSILKLFPKENLAIAVLTNTFDESAVIDVERRIAAAVLPQYSAALRDEAARQKNTPLEPSLPKELRGRWTGTVYTWQSKLPMIINFRPDGDVHVKIGDQIESLVQEIQYRDGNLVGRFAASIPTEDAMRHPHTVALNLWLDCGVLRGEASALTWDTELNYFDLPSYVELARSEVHK